LSGCTTFFVTSHDDLIFKTILILGSTGFDSEINEIVSTSCNGLETRKRLNQLLNGENNYALAA